MTNTNRRQPFFAVRVVVREVGGSTFTRDYVRGEERMGRSKFTAFAVGDMVGMVSTPGQPITWETFEVDPATVQENRKYHHTTH